MKGAGGGTGEVAGVNKGVVFRCAWGIVARSARQYLGQTIVSKLRVIDWLSCAFNPDR